MLLVVHFELVAIVSTLLRVESGVNGFVQSVLVVWLCVYLMRRRIESKPVESGVCGLSTFNLQVSNDTKYTMCIDLTYV